MNHPPVPLKSRRFHQYVCGKVVFDYSGAWQDIEECPKDLIAAIAEVEWRKRAERWHRLANSHRLDSKRHEDYWKAGELCDEHADAWRAWAEQ